jgi:hypothetical protein
MNKLIKPLFGILFILTLSLKSYGQQYYPVRPQRRIVQPQRYPARPQRYPVAPPQRYPPAAHFNPAYPRPYPPMNRVPAAGQRVEAVKEAFISQQLNLTPEQSRAFWPLYRQYVEDQTAVRILKRQNNSNNSPNGTVQIDKELQYEAQLVNIRKHYRDEFLRVLPPEKVSEIYKSERAFNDEMVRTLTERSIKAGN